VDLDSFRYFSDDIYVTTVSRANSFIRVRPLLCRDKVGVTPSMARF